jgi:hypothetical protein
MQMTEVRHLHHNLKVNATSCRWPKSVIYITTWKWMTRHADNRSPSFTSQLESKWRHADDRSPSFTSQRESEWHVMLMTESVIYITNWKLMTRHANDRSPSFTSPPISNWHVMQMTEVRHLHHNLKVNDTSCRWPKSIINITTWKRMKRHADDQSPSFTSQLESECHVMQMTEVRHLHYNL